MGKQITVPIFRDFDVTSRPVGSVTIDEDEICLLSNFHLGAGYIAHLNSTEVKELLHFGLSRCPIDND